MKRFVHKDRAAYLKIQIARSRAKFGYCKVPWRDVLRYRWRWRRLMPAGGPIACLGVRNGREMTRFRLVFRTEVIGVEINPDAQRRDLWVGSFDRMPAEWTDRFALVFSNSFDHADDPKVTALEWRRILMPGGLLILAHNFGAVEPTESDCTQLGQVEEACALFGMTLIETGQGHYPEAVLRKP